MDLPKWLMRDPSLVCERLQEMRQRQAGQQKESRQEKAAREIKELFKETPGDTDNK